MALIAIIAFLVFYIISVSVDSHFNFKLQKRIGIVACLVLTFIAGRRDVTFWPDTGVYVLAFYKVPNIFSFSLNDTPYGYEEKGFALLGSLLKVFTNNGTAYLFFIAALSVFILYEDLRKYSIYPLIGLCCYIARFFMNRNMIQIRAGLSYAILLFAIQYITKKDWKRYFLIVAIAYTIHQSALIAIPLYFFCNWIKPRKWHVFVVIIIAFVVGIAGQEFVHNIVEDNATDLNVEVYTERGGYKSYYEGQGLKNPMIYFETILLLIYTLAENKLRLVDKNYYVIRMAYLYSTAFLISFCTYKVLASRTSSIFATLEFCVIPSLIYAVPKRNRIVAFEVTGVALLLIFRMYLMQNNVLNIKY